MTSLPKTFLDLWASLEAEDLSSDSEADPVEEVVGWERGGKTINEHSSLEDYVKRLAHFLGEHPDYKHLTDLFPIARRAAEEIFRSQHEQLSVQEVRRREIAAEEFPLLPFPTTDNCQTLDNFESYPQEEWTPATVPPAETSSKTATSSKTHPANTTKTLVQPEQTADIDLFEASKAGGESTPAFSSSSNIMSEQQSSNPRALSLPTVGGTTSHLRDLTGVAMSPEYTPEVMETIHERLGKAEDGVAPNRRLRNNDSQSSGLMIAGEGVASYSGRGIINQPVKTTNRGKRAAALTSRTEEASESDDTAEQTADQERPPTKKPKVSSSPRKPNRLAAPSKERTSGASKTTSLGDLKPDHFEAVISGGKLPRTLYEARNAAEVRYKRLLSEHKKAEKEAKGSSKSSRAERARKNDTNPDILPEFFKVENFAKGEEGDSVRCVCGVVTNDGGEMIACDECGVWQHNACMGDALPDDVESGKYLCHVCDPFAHGAVVAGLRRANPLNG